MDEDQAQPTPAVDDAPPLAGTTEPTPAVDAETAKWKRELEDARKDAARYRTERKALEARLAVFEAQQKAAEEAKLSDLEKAQRAADEAAAKLAALEAERAQLAERTRLLATQNAVLGVAGSAGIGYADAAWKLLDRDKVEYDDNGNPKNLDALAKALVKAYPFLASGVAASATGNPPKATEPGPAEREAAIRAKLYGTPQNFLDPVVARSMGGGVVQGKE